VLFYSTSFYLDFCSENGVPEVSRWNLDLGLYDNEIYNYIHDQLS